MYDLVATLLVLNAPVWVFVGMLMWEDLRND